MKKNLLLSFLFLLPGTSVPNNITVDLQEFGYTGEVTAFIDNIKAGILYFTKESPQEFYIWKLLVGDEFDSKEIGTALIEKALQFAKNKGYSQINLDPTSSSPAFPSSIPGISSNRILDFDFYKFGFHALPNSTSTLTISNNNSFKNALQSLQQTIKEHPYMTAGIATMGLIAIVEYQTGFIRKKLAQLKQAISKKLFNTTTPTPKIVVNKASRPSMQPASQPNL